MARISGLTCPEKRVEIGLTYITALAGPQAMKSCQDWDHPDLVSRI
jgi:hypothetical protein